MSKDKLQEIFDNLPYSIRHSGDLQPLKIYAEEQTQLAQEFENKLGAVMDKHTYLEGDYYKKEKQNKQYRELLERAFKADDLEDIWNIEDEYRALESDSDE